MSKSQTTKESAAAGLHRLPPGRHGLSREFVTQNQRDRLAAGIISAVAERGYHDTTITEIAAAAGVSRRTFYAYFKSKEECYFATFDLIAEHLRQAGSEAAAEFEDWPQRVRARIGAVLEAFSANPDLVRFALIAPPRAGAELASRYGKAVEQVRAELTAGMPEDVQPPSEAVQHSLIGGMAALVVRQVEARDGKNLSDLMPDLVEIALTPYIGRAEAIAVARQD